VAVQANVLAGDAALRLAIAATGNAHTTQVSVAYWMVVLLSGLLGVCTLRCIARRALHQCHKAQREEEYEELAPLRDAIDPSDAHRWDDSDLARRESHGAARFSDCSLRHDQRRNAVCQSWQAYKEEELRRGTVRPVDRFIDERLCAPSAHDRFH